MYVCGVSPCLSVVVFAADPLAAAAACACILRVGGGGGGGDGGDDGGGDVMCVMVSSVWSAAVTAAHGCVVYVANRFFEYCRYGGRCILRGSEGQRTHCMLFDVHMVYGGRATCL